MKRTGDEAQPGPGDLRAYLDYSGRDDVLSGGVKLIPVETPAGTFRVWTKRVGNNPILPRRQPHGYGRRPADLL